MAQEPAISVRNLQLPCDKIKPVRAVTNVRAEEMPTKQNQFSVCGERVFEQASVLDEGIQFIF